ncbi:major facilitator superfamily domain-containing protein [Aspergillus insuetus]
MMRVHGVTLGTCEKWYITCFVSMLNVITCWCAGGFSSGATQIAEELHVSTEVTTLCLSMYVLGFAIGPVLLAPLSEYFGRQPVYLVSWFAMALFQLPLALAPNIGTIIICRFIAGFAGGAPLTNTGGTVSDLWERNESGGPMAVYGLSSTFGPPTALVMSGYIGLDLGWRWIFWILMAISGGFWIALGLHQLFSITLTRPFVFLFTEPITTFSAAYNGFLYGLVYLFNEAFPLERHYLRRVAENNGKAVPEARMWMARFGSLLIPMSLFWFGWSSYSSVHWIVPIIASSFFGAGLYIVIWSILNYLVDSYQTYSASALAGVILVRNVVGAGFPLFATQMYERLGDEWASSLPGLIAILLVPIPFVFFYKGEGIRLKSPWAREHFDSGEDAPH